jgi:hypothetical protein
MGVIERLFTTHFGHSLAHQAILEADVRAAQAPQIRCHSARSVARRSSSQADAPTGSSPVQLHRASPSYRRMEGAN